LLASSPPKLFPHWNVNCLLLSAASLHLASHGQLTPRAVYQNPFFDQTVLVDPFSFPHDVFTGVLFRSYSSRSEHFGPPPPNDKPHRSHERSFLPRVFLAGDPVIFPFPLLKTSRIPTVSPFFSPHGLLVMVLLFW